MVNLKKTIRDLEIRGRIIFGEDLKRHNTLKIGGKVDIFIEPFSWEDIEKVVIFSQRNEIPLLVLGGGSKLLFPDESLKAIILNLDNPFFKKIVPSRNGIKLDSGVKVKELLLWMSKHGIGGLEFLAGIPASIGGAVYLNAGVREKKGYLQIGDFIEELTVMDKFGRILRLDKSKLKFEYRKSNLSGYIILEVILSKMVERECSEIKKRIGSFLSYRRKTQELKFPNAGCVFKNPSKDKSAGELIELSGLKGKRIGDIMVSQRHGNFFLNVGDGKAKDFLFLMEYVQKRVKRDHRIWLEPEIIVVNDGYQFLEKF